MTKLSVKESAEAAGEALAALSQALKQEADDALAHHHDKLAELSLSLANTAAWHAFSWKKVAEKSV